MLRIGITVGCALAMLAAMVLSVLLRGTRRTPSPLRGDEPFRERLAVTTGRTAGMVAGAALSGILTIGAGGRLMMRTLAATSGDDVQGSITEAEEVVGAVTLSGSLFLILALGIGSGVAGLVLFAALRRWLPDRSLAAGLIGVAIGAGLLVRPSGLIADDNRDFTLLRPVPLAVALCLAMITTFGASFGVLVDRLAARWPRPGWSVPGVFSVVPLAILLMSPPLFVGVVVGILVGTELSSDRTRGARDDPDVPRVEAGGGSFGRAAIAVAGALGALSVVVAAGQVLAL